jgi:hypothetical protein
MNVNFPFPSVIGIGRACGMLRVMPDRIDSAAGDLKILPAIFINGIAHYHESDLERIRLHLATRGER